MLEAAAERHGWSFCMLLRARNHGFQLQRGRYGFETQLPPATVGETRQGLARGGSASSIPCGRRRPWGATARKGLGVAEPALRWGWMRRALRTPSRPICQGWHGVRLPAREANLLECLDNCTPKKPHISPPWQPVTDLNTNSWIPFLRPQKMRAAR